eukprot:3882831-Pyramimonas_sp.AAC.1
MDGADGARRRSSGSTRTLLNGPLSPYEAVSPLENSILPPILYGRHVCPCRALGGADAEAEHMLPLLARLVRAVGICPLSSLGLVRAGGADA